MGPQNRTDFLRPHTTGSSQTPSGLTVQEGFSSAHCKHGHLLDAENTSYYSTSEGKVWRVCKTCRKTSKKASYLRNRAIRPRRLRTKEERRWAKIELTKLTLEERFWLKVESTPEQECWLWTGSRSTHWGYGFLFFKNQRLAAHRVSWEIANGQEIPPGFFVIHSCDVPLCVNPSHLRLGTAADNMADTVERGRHGNLRKTHCIRGHAFDATNTSERRGRRTCRTCHGAARGVANSTAARLTDADREFLRRVKRMLSRSG